MNIISAQELLNKSEQSGPREWHGWEYDPELKTLIYSLEPYYEIDMERVDSTGELLDWIFEINCKVWATAECVAGLVNAFHDLLDPQRNYCSRGENAKGLDGGAIANAHYWELTNRKKA